MLNYLAVIATGGPQTVARSLNRIAFLWQGEIKRHAPVDNGLFRASIAVDRAVADSAYVIAQVGSNVEYAIYLEYGSHKQRGYMQQVAKWKPGDPPVTRWYAKDGDLAKLLDRRDRASDQAVKHTLDLLMRDMNTGDRDKISDKATKAIKRYYRTKRQVEKAFDPSSEEFGPPFRASWDRIADDAIDMVRNDLANLLKERARVT